MARKQAPKKRPELAKSEIVADLPLACADEGAAQVFLEQQRWGGKPCCPHCQSETVYRMTGATAERRGLWRCRDCKRQFTVRVGTIYEDSAIPLNKWCRAFWEACKAKNGVSALELSRTLQITYKSALFVMHRIRHAMSGDPTTPTKLTGTVESDEVYIGGKPRFKGPHNKRGRGTTKQPVMVMVQRGGNVRTRIIPTVNAYNVLQVLRENVDPSANLMTDQETSYNKAGPEFASHEVVNHGLREYVRGNAHTNTAEGFNSRVKRSLNGTYHAVSRTHLHRYMDQFAFTYNTRTLNDGERTTALIRKTGGKRLRYREPLGGRAA